MSKPDQHKEEKQITISLPQEGYPKTMFFNRLQVERQEEFCIVHFGLVSNSNNLLDSYSCVLPQRSLDQNKKSLGDYLGKIGAAKQKNPQLWQSEKAGATTDVADIINMSNGKGLAETTLFVFSITAATRQRGGDAIKAQPLVLLRSSVELQKQLIEGLYV